MPGHQRIKGNEIVEEISKGVRLSPENVIDIDKPVHCLCDDKGLGHDKEDQNAMERST